MDSIRIAVLGDYNPAFRSHPLTTEALQHTSICVGAEVAVEWIPTPELKESVARLEAFDGIFASPGSPYRSFEGMLKGIEFARRRDWPFTAT